MLGCGHETKDKNMDEYDYKAAYEAGILADRMALGLPAIADKLRGDMDEVKKLRDEQNTYIEIGKRWRENSSLEEWFPFSAQKLKSLEVECGNAAAIILKQDAEINSLRAQLEQPNEKS